MTSTSDRPKHAASEPTWRAAGLRFYAYRHFLRERFAGRVYRVSLDGGFTCPNVDGRLATGGCVYCDNRSFSPSRRQHRGSIADQLADGMLRLHDRYGANTRFLAYFQPATNTYAPVATLRSLFEASIDHPLVVGLAVGTRPDCVPAGVLDLLAELAQRTYVCVEYGMQTMHDRSLDWMNRGHHHAAMIDAVERSRGLGFDVAAHLILGLPSETHADMLATARELARLQLDAVKFHNLHAVANTRLAEQVRSGAVKLMERDPYITTLADMLELIPPETVVQRISGDAPREFLVGPSWCLDKAAVRRLLDAELERRNSWQGKRQR